MSTLFIRLLSANATTPTAGSADAAGYDLYAAEDLTVPAHGKALVKTDISMSIPRWHYGRIAPRSGLAWKHHIDVGAGVIDRDYRGNVGVILFNHSGEDFKVNVGDRIAQLILEKYSRFQVCAVDELPTTERGSQGFGSTGK